jgi:hypothetical protein
METVERQPNQAQGTARKADSTWTMRARAASPRVGEEQQNGGRERARPTRPRSTGGESTNTPAGPRYRRIQAKISRNRVAVK